MVSKILSILLFLLFGITPLFAGAASASNYTVDFPIFVYGDVQSIQNAFTFVSAIASSSDINTLIALIVAIMIPFSAYSYFKTGDGREFTFNLTFLTASILFMDSVHLGTSIHIEDLRTETNYAGLPAKTYAKVDNIPYPISLVTASVSTIIDTTKTLYRDAANLIEVANGVGDLDSISALSGGYASALGDLLKVLKASTFNTTDANSATYARKLSAYMLECVLNQAVSQTPSLISKIISPTDDIFDEINPTNLGIDGAGYEMEYQYDTGPIVKTCKDFYDNDIAAEYTTQADALIERLNKVTIMDLSSSDVVSGLNKVGAIDINSSFIANEVGKFRAYAMNLAASGSVNNAFRNMGTDLASGQDVANAITAASSLATIQNEGVGSFQWMAEILPMGFHYMLGIIYSISIMVMIVASSLGAQKGIMLWKNFVKGLLVFQFIDVALVIVDSSINQYAAVHAADIIASIGQNPGAISAIPEHFHYLATMSGISGILGISAVFIIPSMVFSGEVAMAAGTLSGLSSAYKRNNIATATKESAEQHAREDAYERELEDQAKLDHMGVVKPAGMGATDYYNELKRGASESQAGYGSLNMGREAISDSAKAIKGQTMQSIASGATMANNMSMDDFVSSGYGQGLQGIQKTLSAAEFGNRATVDDVRLSGTAEGAMQAGNTRATATASTTFGNDALESGVFNQSLQKLSTTAGLKDMSEKEAVDSGMYGAGNAIAKARGAQRHMGLNSNWQDDLDTLEKKKSDSIVGSAAGVNMAKDKYGDSAFIQTAAHSELSQVAQTMGRIQAVGGIERSANISEQDSALKASQQVSTLNSQYTEANKQQTTVDDAADKIATAIEKLASTTGTLAGSKTRSDIRSIDTAGGSEDFMEMNAGVSAIKTAQSMTSVNAAKDAGFLNSSGNVTDKGMNAYGIQAGEAASILGVKESVFFGEDGKKNVANVREQMLKKGIDAKTGERDENGNIISKEQATQMVNSALNSAGLTENATGQDAINALAKMGAMNYASSKTLSLAGVQYNMGVDADGNIRIGSADASEKIAKGDSRSTGVAMKFAETMARSILGENSSYDDVKELAGKLHDSAALTNFATSKEGTIQGGTAALKGLADQFKGGKFEKAVNDFVDRSGDGQLTDDDAKYGGAILATAGGVAANAASKKLTGESLYTHTKDAVGNARNSLFGWSKNESADSTQHNNSNATDNHPESNGKHSTHSSNRNLAGQPLNELIDSTTHNYTANGVEVKPKGGFLSNMFDEISDVFHGGGSLKTKGVMAAAAILGASQSELLANTLNAIDPIANVMGQPLGAGSDVVPQQSNASFQRVDLGNLSNVAPLTSQAISQDKALPQAIDSYNTNQNIQAMNTTQQGNSIPMESRNGTMLFSQSSKNGNLAVTLPGSDFKTHTQIPFKQFQDVLNDPTMQQQFAQMVAQSSLEAGMGSNVSNMSGLEQFKNEMQSSLQSIQFQSSTLGVKSDSSVMLAQETMIQVEDQLSMVENLTSDLALMNEKIESLRD